VILAALAALSLELTDSRGPGDGLQWYRVAVYDSVAEWPARTELAAVAGSDTVRAMEVYAMSRDRRTRLPLGGAKAVRLQHVAARLRYRGQPAYVVMAGFAGFPGAGSRVVLLEGGPR
jgi:hypothetical protein